MTAAPALLLSLSLLLSSCGERDPATCRARGTGIQAAAEHLRAEARDGYSGTVVVTEPGAQLRYATEGLSPEATRFWIASISKTFAATTAVRLAAQGRLDLDATVGDAFAQVTGPIAGVRLVDLLAHRSGLGAHYSADGIADRDRAVQAIAASGIEEEGFFYSNDGFNLAAAMMEALTGKKYEELVREQVIEPLRLTATGFWSDGRGRGDFAPYSRRDVDGVLRRGAELRNYGYLASTGIYSTAVDLDRFLAAVTGDAFLSESEKRLLFSTKRTVEPGRSQSDGRSYGLGWALELDDGKTARIQQGGFESHLHNAEIAATPGGDRRLAVLAASAEDDDYAWSDRIRDGVRDCLQRRSSASAIRRRLLSTP